MIARVILTVSIASIMGCAQAQSLIPQKSPCGPRAEIIDQLQQKHGETPRGAGMQSPMLLVEIWRNAETGTWTILHTRPNGQSCIVGAGKHWRDLEAEPLKL